MTDSSRENGPAGRSERARRRAELWNMTFRALYGKPRGEHVGAWDLDPASIQATEFSGSRAELVARPAVLRRLLAPLAASDRLHDLVGSDEYNELVLAATRDLDPRPSTPREAHELLLRHGGGRDAPCGPHDIERRLHALAKLLAPEELLRIDPAIVSLRDGVARVSRSARFRLPFDVLVRHIDPKNWLGMGTFFDRVGPVEGEYHERALDGWHGLFEEYFVIDWSILRLHSVHTFLNVDFTFEDDRARVDYSLVYEEHDQLEEDSGFLEVRRIPGRLGWCSYYGEKAMRMRSPLSNIFAPMLTAVFLEHGLSAIEDDAVRRHTMPAGKDEKSAA